MLIEIWADIVCPWCYIGDNRLDAALKHIGARDDVHVVYRPFQLDPSAPPEPISVLEAYSVKFGGETRAKQMMDQVTSVAASEGLEINFEIAQRANTFDAHRTVALAANENLDREMIQRLFKAYFVDGENINDHNVLANLAAEVGLDREAVTSMLNSDAKGDVVRSSIDRAHKIDVRAVPTFLVNKETMASGALEKHQLVQLFEQARADARAT